jgi:hypothetical protein
MKRTWVAVLAIVLGAGPAGTCGELPSQLPSAPAAVMPPAPAPDATTPPPADGAALPAPAAPDAHAAAPGGGCDHCRPHGSCWQRLCDWACYRPLPCYCSACFEAGHVHCLFHHGCDGCGAGCCYNCFPPLYLWFLKPCHERAPHTLPCKGCGSCANGHPPEPAPAAAAAPPLPAPPAVH